MAEIVIDDGELAEMQDEIEELKLLRIDVANVKRALRTIVSKSKHCKAVDRASALDGIWRLAENAIDQIDDKHRRGQTKIGV